MNVCVCNGCSKKILASKCIDNKCFACGTINKVDDNDKKTYIESIIDESEKELILENYEKAVSLYDQYIERFPNIGTLYFGRFMAKQTCCNTEQLLMKGVPFDTDSDFQVALHLASNDERECYENLSQLRKEITKQLIGELKVAKKAAIKNTGIEDIQQSTLQELITLREELANQLSRLECVEKELREKDFDCIAQVNCGKSGIDVAIAKLGECKTEIIARSECESKERNCMNVRMVSNLVVCDSIINITQRLSETAVFAERNNCMIEQKSQEKAVMDVIRDIKNVNTRMETLLENVKQIIQRYERAISLVNESSFAEARALLGSKGDDLIFQTMHA